MKSMIVSVNKSNADKNVLKGDKGVIISFALSGK